MTAMKALERLNKAISRGCSPTGFNALNTVYLMLKQREIDEAWRQYRKSPAGGRTPTRETGCQREFDY